MSKRAANPVPLALPEWSAVVAAQSPDEAARRLADVVRAACDSLGFALSGICGASPIGEADEYNQWIADGKHGSMAWLAEQAATKADARVELPSAKSILMVADRYALRGSGEAVLEPLDGAIAKYARGRDYHLTVKNRLHKLADAIRAHLKTAPPRFGALQPDGQPHEFRSFVDTAPVHERAYAQLAGLGWRGKHTLLIHPTQGSFLLLGGMLTTLELLPASTPSSIVQDRCGTCTRCIDACPTQAITPYSVDARRCIAYLTIEHSGPIDPALQPSIGNWLYGCDICQDVCPHNSPRPAETRPTATAELLPDYSPRRSAFNLLEVLGWDETGKRRAAVEGTAMKWASLEMLKRNATIVARNKLADGSTAKLLSSEQRAALESAVSKSNS